MPQKYLEFWGTRMMVSPKFFGNTLLWSQSQKLYGKKSPKCLPSRQKNQFCAKEAVRKRSSCPPCPGTGGAEGSPSSCRNIWNIWNIPLSQSLWEGPGWKKVLEVREAPAASPAPEIPCRSFIPCHSFPLKLGQEYSAPLQTRVPLPLAMLIPI